MVTSNTWLMTVLNTDLFTSLPLPIRWVKVQSRSNTRPRFSPLFNVSKAWLGQSASTTPLVCDLAHLPMCLSTYSILAGVLSLTFPRMSTVMTPTGACKSISRAFLTRRLANTASSRILCRAQPHRLVHDLLFRERNQAAHSRGTGP